MHTTNLALVLRTRAALVVCITRDSFECSHHSCFALVIRAFNFTRGLKFRHLFLLYGTRAVEEWLSPRPPRGRILYFMKKIDLLVKKIFLFSKLDQIY